MIRALSPTWVLGANTGTKTTANTTSGFRGRLNSAGFLTLHMENFMGQGASDHAKIIKRVVQQMRTRYGVDRINIVAHSKGRLDSRAYISNFTHNPDNDVETLITLATPPIWFVHGRGFLGGFLDGY